VEIDDRVVIDHPGPTPEVQKKAQAASAAVKRSKAAERRAEAVRLKALGWENYRIALRIGVGPEQVRIYLAQAAAMTQTNGGGSDG
jgi:hypothetical protein